MTGDISQTGTGAATLGTGGLNAKGGINVNSNSIGVGWQAGVIGLPVTGSIRWAPDSSGIAASGTGIFLDAANTLAQRNGVNAQTFNIYNTYTDGSNYERGFFDWTTAANTFTIGVAKAGTGSSRSVNIKSLLKVTLTANTVPLLWDSDGTFELNGRGGFLAQADGVISIWNHAQTDFGRLQFGGTTSSFPALKRSTTILQARLADDSAFGSLQGKLTTDTNATTGLTAGVLAATTNASIVLFDGSGQAYRVPCII